MSEYRSPDGHFRVEFPGEPEEDEGFAILETPEASYSVNHSECSPEELEGHTPHEVMEFRRDVGSIEYDLVSSKTLTIGDHPALDSVLRMKDGTTMVLRSVLRGGRLYLIVVVGDRETADRPKTRDFMESFELMAE